MSLFQSNLRRQFRNLPKILNFLKIIHYYSKLFTGVLSAAGGDADADDGDARLDSGEQLHQAPRPRQHRARLEQEHALALAHVITELGQIEEIVAVQEAAGAEALFELAFQPSRLGGGLNLEVGQEGNEAALGIRRKRLLMMMRGG